MLSPERLDAMQSQFARLLGGYGVGPAAAYPVFDRLVATHAEPHRHYHTLEHVAEVLRVAGRLTKLADDPAAVQLAVWFHDAVYDPTRDDNESASALMAAEILDGNDLLLPNVVTVVELIVATKHADAAEVDANTAVLLDADLAILGAAEARYERYAADIRKEYAHVPEEAYRTGRRAVLDRFLARQRIFRTDVMYAEGEAAARRNLAAEIARL